MKPTFLAALAALVAAALPSAGHADDPKDFGGGTCAEMTKAHDPETLWVGRVIGPRGTASGGLHTIACFPDEPGCIKWVSRTSGPKLDRIIEADCTKGVSTPTPS